MTASSTDTTNQDWRTSDPVWADDLRPGAAVASISTELFTASFGLMALIAAMVAVLA